MFRHLFISFIFKIFGIKLQKKAGQTKKFFKIRQKVIVARKKDVRKLILMPEVYRS